MNRWTRPQTRWIAIWLGATLIVTLGAYGVGLFIDSPWEQASRNADLTLAATATIEEHEFAAITSAASGTVSLGASVDVVRATGGEGAGVAVVTGAAVVPGDAVGSGQVIAEISGRPVIALSLPFRLYRDLSPGMYGRDVGALQSALTELGLYQGSADQTYGAQTAAAVRALYARIGWSAPTASTEVVAAVEEASTVSTDAQAALRNARTAAENARALRAHAAASASAEEIAALDLQVAESEVAQSAAVSAADHAASVLAEARLLADTPLPAAEFLALTQSPVQVVSVAPVDTLVDETTPAVRLRTGAPSAVVRVGVDDQKVFTEGATVSVAAREDATQVAEGTVLARGDFTAAGDGDVPGYDVTLAFTGVDLPFEDGAAVVAEVKDAAPATVGPAVPLVAVREDSEGRFVLRVVTAAHGQTPAVTERVAVTLGVSESGVALIQSGDLTVGDEVLIGDVP